MTVNLITKSIAISSIAEMIMMHKYIGNELNDVQKTSLKKE